MRSPAEIKADIDALKRDIGQASKDDFVDMQSDLMSLFEELDEAMTEEARKRPFPPIAPTGGGLDLVKVAKAFGGIPKEWDE